jgi:glyoxylase-like metal-dependent hydrolase (beta-lactamase superfamily II)
MGGDLIGGDLVAGFDTIVIDPPEGDMDDYLASLERMRGRGFRTLFPSHGAPILEVDGGCRDVEIAGSRGGSSCGPGCARRRR